MNLKNKNILVTGATGGIGNCLVKKFYETEASGNINLKSVKSVVSTGVDRVSIGSLTHSAPSIDSRSGS